MPSDVLANVEARGLLLDLDEKGVRLFVRAGTLMTKAAARLTPDDRAAIRQHKPDLLVLVLICADATLDRLLALRAGTLGRERHERGCYLCGQPLPSDRPLGRCGWCALACRLHAGGPVPADLIALFPESIRGTTCPQLRPGRALPFDCAQPTLELQEA
ncbi:hypothetical protein LuPra_03811 [Luteitalea pratensis]|uniref:TubC N-terminal docking domain-containing protein n=1 Tax=Luteitalea pratensis TaxID=1855912 RepID=A0A143PRY4_LUTPR|nr:hypothetical protein [Luteitalea pratensis]AMY10574.1 hypothetical protein LuPra_03811 [Luteitalea pratensis]